MTSVLIIETFATDPKQNILIEEVTQVFGAEKISYARVAVTHILEAPIALRLAVETMKVGSESKLHRPDGFIILGHIQKNEPFPSIVYEEVIRSLQDMACYYGLALSHGIFFEDGQNTAFGGQKAALSCMNLMRLKTQFGLNPSHISAP